MPLPSEFVNPFRYLAPFAIWIGITQIQIFFEGQSLFWIYGLKTVLTAILLALCFRGRGQELRGNFDPAAIGAGALVLLVWILCSVLFGPAPASKASFNPFVFQSQPGQFLAIAFRIAGAAGAVPWVEELFWRAFLMRYLISREFLKVPLGAYSHFSFWLTALGFALFHSFRDWPAAFLAGLVYGGYLARTGNFRGCVLAHATTNLGLAVYVLITKSWWMWG